MALAFSESDAFIDLSRYDVEGDMSVDPLFPSSGVSVCAEFISSFNVSGSMYTFERLKIFESVVGLTSSLMISYCV